MGLHSGESGNFHEFYVGHAQSAFGARSPSAIHEPLRALGLEDPAARDFAEGALNALVAMRSLLQLDVSNGGK